ncbi:MAG: phenylacetate--CoA ligase family protein [Thermodesulfobacteriota bacterium]
MTRYSDIKDPHLECLDPERLNREFEIPRLKNQLVYVLDRSEFYQKKLANYPRDSLLLLKHFRDLPFTTKEEILKDQEDNPPFGSNLCAERKDLVRLHKTSGTSNRPYVIAMTRNDIEVTTSAGSRCFTASGLKPYHTVVHCLNYCMWIGGLTDHESLERTGALVIPFGVGNSRLLIQTICNLDVDAIHCTPSYFKKLEELLKTDFQLDPKELGLKLGLFGGEGGIDDPGVRSDLESKWGIKAMNANYGMADVLSMFGAECQFQKGLHFMGQGSLMVELINPETLENLPLAEGSVGEIVLTNLNREAQPLVRFRSRDIAEILHIGRCECGRASFRFRSIGRSDDMIVVKGINVFPSAIRGRLSLYLDQLTGYFQLLVNSRPPVDKFTLKVEYAGTPDEQSKSNICERLMADLKSNLGVTPNIQLVPKGSLPRTEGKCRLVMREGS